MLLQTEALDTRYARAGKAEGTRLAGTNDNNVQLGNSASLQKRLKLAKRSYITRRMEWEHKKLCLLQDIAPKSGDLVLARIDKLGHHKRLEDPNGRRRYLHVGDEVLLCYAARYATDQFEAVVPGDLQPCQMVAAGGIAAQCLNKHGGTRPATQITPLGLVGNGQGSPLNLRDFAHQALHLVKPQPHTIAVLGTSMNSGKTTTAATLVRHLTADGKKVGVGKITGTGAGGDRWKYMDAGAQTVLDFSDCGYASTSQLSATAIESIAKQLVAALTQAGSEVIVLEVADGIFFEETSRLAQSSLFCEMNDEVILTASDSAGAMAGEQWLTSVGLSPVVIAGTLTSSPLAVREARRMLNTPVLSLKEIREGGLCEGGAGA